MTQDTSSSIPQQGLHSFPTSWSFTFAGEDQSH
jgi:hypothetical protein